MRRIPSPVVLLLMVALGANVASAQTTLGEWGTYATTAYADCAEFCDPLADLDWLLTFTFDSTESGENLGTIAATLSNARGDSFAEASVDVGLGPIVRVDADSMSGGFVDGTGTAVQGYTYVGAMSDTIDVNVHLTGTVGNPDSDPATGLAAQVSFVADENVAGFTFENAVLGLGAPDGAVALEQSTSGSVDLSDVLSIPVDPGDQFYLVVSSAATAAGTNAFAESLGTLEVTFDAGDAANLEAASAPAAVVPGLSWPWAIGLIGSLGGVGARARASRSSRAES